MVISKEQANLSIKFLQDKSISDNTHSSEYKIAIDALNAICKVNDVITKLETLDKENWDRSSSNYYWYASKAYEASSALVKIILKMNKLLFS